MKGQGPKEKLFKKYKGGDGTALLDLLEGEREGLYDYLLRMTGQVSRSAETIDEVFQSFNEDTLDVLASYVDLKICLYTTARKFNADIWNAETSRLVNSALEGPPGQGERTPPALKERQALQALDRQLRGIPGRVRDILLLRHFVGFENAQIAEIMSLEEEEVESLLWTGVNRPAADAGGAGAFVEGLAKLPLHALPPQSSQATINLSMVMQGIKTKPVGLWSPVRLVTSLIVLGLLAFWLWNPDLVRRILEELRGN